jgi:NAD(P)H-dependent FMN reductase
MRILAISGSLRRASMNTCLLRAAAALAPPGLDIVLHRLDLLPPFNPDDDDIEAPVAPVSALRDAVTQSDGVLIASPEYAHGVPGVLKNALDWLVASGELVDKPVALLNASPRSQHAPAALCEILTVMAAHLVPEASITLPLQGRAPEVAALLADDDIAGSLARAVAEFVRAIEGRTDALGG